MARPYQWQNRIRFVDTDASQRIHYGDVPVTFEAAEQEFLRDMGCPYSDPAFRDVSFPRVHVECDFTAEIRYDDVITIELTIVARVGTSSFTISFHVTVDARPVAKGSHGGYHRSQDTEALPHPGSVGGCTAQSSGVSHDQLRSS